MQFRWSSINFSVMTKVNIYFTIFHQRIWIRIKINCLYSHLLLAEFCLTSYKPTSNLITRSVHNSSERKCGKKRPIWKESCRLGFFFFFSFFLIWWSLVVHSITIFISWQEKHEFISAQAHAYFSHRSHCDDQTQFLPGLACSYPTIVFSFPFIFVSC